MQPPRKCLIRASNLTQQAVYRNPEGSRELGGVKSPNQSAFELGRYFLWQQVHAAAMDSWKAVANAGERERVVANTADHIFRLPNVSSGNRAPRVECV